MALEDRRIFAEGRQDVPSKYAAGVSVPLRSTLRGELHTAPLGKAAYAVADEGSYYVARNPTPGTGIAGIAATGAFSDAESLLFLRNDASAGTGTRIYLDYLRIVVTAAGTNGTDHRFVSKVDTGVTRYTSGGSAITPANPNMQSSNTASCTMYFGAVVTAAATANARTVGGGLIRPVITVVGDVYTFDFGGYSHPAPGHAAAGTAIAHVPIRHAPVVLGPADQFVLSLHATAQDGASSYEFELGFWER